MGTATRACATFRYRPPSAAEGSSPQHNLGACPHFTFQGKTWKPQQPIPSLCFVFSSEDLCKLEAFEKAQMWGRYAKPWGS